MSVAASYVDAILLHNIPIQYNNDIQTEIRMPERYIKYLQLVQTDLGYRTDGHQVGNRRGT